MRPRDEGQAVVEMALVLPLLLFMIGGLFSFGQYVSAQQVLHTASREGARVGSLGAETSAIRLAVERSLKAAGLTQPPALAVSHQNETGLSLVSVEVTYPLGLALTLPGLPNPLPIRARTTMRIE